MNPTIEAGSPRYRVVTVTPDLAREWLKRNNRNRALHPQRVTDLAEAMKRGEWTENGDTITFSESGDVQDGQHRLAAVVKSGVPIRCLVVEGLPDEAQDTKDVGARRTFAAVLQIRGVASSTNVAALARLVFDHGTGQLRSHNHPPSHAQLLAVVEKHLDELRESNRVGKAVRRQLPISQNYTALAHWLCMPLDPDDSEFFFARLRDGQGLVEGDPIFALRKAIILDAIKPRNRMDGVHHLALIIKAWNAYRKGEKIIVLAWRSGGARPEVFPEPV